MRQQGMVGLAVLTLAAGMLLIGAPGSAQPERRRAVEPGRAILLPRRTNPRLIPGAGIPSARARYRLAPRAAFPRARLRRFRRRYVAPYGYYYSYYYPPPAYYYYTPPVTYYYAPSSGYYYYTSHHRRRRHHRYRTRIAGYRGYYPARTPPGWHHGRKRGWRGGSVPPGHVR